MEMETVRHFEKTQFEKNTFSKYSRNTGVLLRLADQRDKSFEFEVSEMVKFPSQFFEMFKNLICLFF